MWRPHPAVARRRRTGNSAPSLPAVACATPDTVIEYVAPVIEFMSPAAAFAASTPMIDSEDPVIEYASLAAACAAPTQVIDSVAPLIEYVSSCAAPTYVIKSWLQHPPSQANLNPSYGLCAPKQEQSFSSL